MSMPPVHTDHFQSQLQFGPPAVAQKMYDYYARSDCDFSNVFPVSHGQTDLYKAPRLLEEQSTDSGSTDVGSPSWACDSPHSEVFKSSPEGSPVSNSGRRRRGGRQAWRNNPSTSLLDATQRPTAAWQSPEPPQFGLPPSTSSHWELEPSAAIAAATAAPAAQHPVATALPTSGRDVTASGLVLSTLPGRQSSSHMPQADQAPYAPARHSSQFAYPLPPGMLMPGPVHGAPPAAPSMTLTAHGLAAMPMMTPSSPAAEQSAQPDLLKEIWARTVMAGEPHRVPVHGVELADLVWMRPVGPEDTPLKVNMERYECEVRFLDPQVPAKKRPPVW